MLAFRGTFPRAGKPCSVPGEHFPGRGNLARFQRNIFPSGKTLPRSWGTFSRAGKPCRARGERFPRRGNLAALVGNIFPGGETLPRSAATLLWAWKPCCVLRQGFNDNLLTAIIPCSLTSGRMRYAPTVSGEKLTRNNATHHRIPQRTNSKYVGAYRIRPPHKRTRQKNGNFHGKTKVCSPPSFPVRSLQGVCDTPLQLAAKNLHETMPHITASPNEQIVNM